MPSFLPRPLNLVRNMRSENWGGLVSMAGTLVLGFGGDMQSVGAMVFSLFAEVAFARFGHKTAGYSAGCALIAGCGVLMLFSVATQGNLTLQILILAASCVWLLGAFRYFIERAGQALFGAKPVVGGRLIKAASVIQPLVGCLALVLRVPVLVAAAIGGNVVVFVAVALYATADVLLGRIHALGFLRFRKTG